jgi:hypothetical protein
MGSSLTWGRSDINLEKDKYFLDLEETNSRSNVKLLEDHNPIQVFSLNDMMAWDALYWVGIGNNSGFSQKYIML